MTRAPLALVAALLAACAGGEGPTSVPAPPPAVAALPPAPSLAPAPIPPPPDPSIARLAGLKPDELQAILGAPGFVRRDRGVEVWQYRNAGCVLHLFLYLEGAEGLRLTHAEARDPDGRLIADAAASRACLNAVSAQRAVG